MDVLALIALVFVGLLYVSPSSTAVDRMAFYVIPIQMLVIGRLPFALARTRADFSLLASCGRPDRLRRRDVRLVEFCCRCRRLGAISPYESRPARWPVILNLPQLPKKFASNYASLHCGVELRGAFDAELNVRFNWPPNILLATLFALRDPGYTLLTWLCVVQSIRAELGELFHWIRRRSGRMSSREASRRADRLLAGLS